MDLEAIASQKADAWQKSADEAAARMRKRDGFCIVQLTAADAATVQAALTLAASALDTQLQLDNPIGKALVKVVPGLLFGTAASCLPAAYEQAAAVLDKVARMVLPLLLRGMRLRSDALSGIMDHIYQPRASSSELHVIRYRGPIDGHDMPNAAGDTPTYVDQSVLTVIAADTTVGLEVGHEPSTEEVPVFPGQVAVLGGHTLAFATGGALQATRHSTVVRLKAEVRGGPGLITVKEVWTSRTALAYKFKGNPTRIIDLRSALHAAGGDGDPSYHGWVHPMAVRTYSRLFRAEHDSINTSQPGGATRVLPVEALFDYSVRAQMLQDERALRMEQMRKQHGDRCQFLSSGVHDIQQYLVRRLTIFVKDLHGRIFTLSGLSALMLVRDLKVLIQEETGVDPDVHRLMFSGRPLADDDSLAHHEICLAHDEHTILMVLRMRGD